MRTLSTWIATLLFTAASAHAAGALPGDSLYQIASPWTNQRGEHVQLSSLQGKPVVIAMIYTRCHATCPMLVNELKRLEESLPDHARSTVQFALFSFDAKGDSAEALTRFAEAHRLDPARWTLYSSDPKATRELASALSVRFKKTQGEDFAHSSVITILDAQGVPRYHRDIGGRPEEPRSVLMGLIGK